MKDDLLLGGYSAPRVDPRDYPTIKCSKCGHTIFENGVVLKEIPGTIVGNGTEPVQYPLQVFVCKKCGAILDTDIKAYKLDDNDIKTSKIDEEKTETKSSSHLIL